MGQKLISVFSSFGLVFTLFVKDKTKPYSNKNEINLYTKTTGPL